jgi:hypothetical protein
VQSSGARQSRMVGMESAFWVRLSMVENQDFEALLARLERGSLCDSLR